MDLNMSPRWDQGKGGEAPWLLRLFGFVWTRTFYFCPQCQIVYLLPGVPVSSVACAYLWNKPDVKVKTFGQDVSLGRVCIRPLFGASSGASSYHQKWPGWLNGVSLMVISEPLSVLSIYMILEEPLYFREHTWTTWELATQGEGQRSGKEPGRSAKFKRSMELGEVKPVKNKIYESVRVERWILQWSPAILRFHYIVDFFFCRTYKILYHGNLRFIVIYFPC